MDKLKLPHAKLFYFSSELYKAHKINENEKLKLKGKLLLLSKLKVINNLKNHIQLY